MVTAERRSVEKGDQAPRCDLDMPPVLPDTLTALAWRLDAENRKEAAAATGHSWVSLIV